MAGAAARAGPGASGGSAAAAVPPAVSAVDPHAARPTIAFFGSERSGASRQAEAYLAHVLQHRRNHDTFGILRVVKERKPELFERFRIEQIPTLLVIENRRVALRVERPRGARELERQLAHWLR